MMNENGRMEEMETMVKGIEYKTTGEILIISAVMMYIISTFSYLVLPFSENMNLFIFGLLIAGATGIVIYGGFQLSYYYKLNEKKTKDNELETVNNQATTQVIKKSSHKMDKKRKDSIGTIFSMIATASYLYIGFMYGLWHPGWIVFLLIPVGHALYDLLGARESY